jgi:OmpA-OmpF porin, OOP family
MVVFAPAAPKKQAGASMKNGSAVVAILGVLAALVAGPASAQDRGYFLGGTGAFAKWNDICNRTSAPCDDETAGWRAFGGYQFNKYVAAEVGFVGLGEASGGDSTGNFKMQSAGMDLSAVFFIPMTTRLSLLGRLGTYRVKTELKQEGPAFGSLTDTAVNSAWVYGAGLNYNLGRLGLRAEYLQYYSIGGTSTGEDTVEMFGLTLLFRFF